MLHSSNIRILAKLLSNNQLQVQNILKDQAKKQIKLQTEKFKTKVIEKINVCFIKFFKQSKIISINICKHIIKTIGLESFITVKLVYYSKKKTDK